MLLMSEHEGVRTYLGADEATWYSVTLEKRSITTLLTPTMLSSYAGGEDEMKRQSERAAGAQLAAWFAGAGDDLGCEAVGEPHMQWVRVPMAFEFDENGQQALDMFDRPIVKEWGERLLIEQLYWPPAPVDPTPTKAGSLEDPAARATLGELRRSDHLRGNTDPWPHVDNAAVRKMGALLPDGQTLESALEEGVDDEVGYEVVGEAGKTFNEVLEEARELLRGLELLYGPAEGADGAEHAGVAELPTADEGEGGTDPKGMSW